MIETFRHKGLKRFYEVNDTRGIGAQMRNRIEEILTLLDSAEKLDDLNIPGYRLHPLVGNRQGEWSIRVTSNWRITFRFENGHVLDVDLEDYH
ncbi:MAG: type II toxin-antitoxin system RelE/ParE family toxin [Caldilineaceae bacterium]|nr:type II toxin-antitoxin system RelE/ParE family toxin [Caldilineaceae bacterium]MCB0094260.1 type II toxin-antitoxin system RelE/ParE family toxin [Caldilineaceae bacterium]